MLGAVYLSPDIDIRGNGAIGHDNFRSNTQLYIVYLYYGVIEEGPTTKAFHPPTKFPPHSDTNMHTHECAFIYLYYFQQTKTQWRPLQSIIATLAPAHSTHPHPQPQPYPHPHPSSTPLILAPIAKYNLLSLAQWKGSGIVFTPSSWQLQWPPKGSASSLCSSS